MADTVLSRPRGVRRTLAAMALFGTSLAGGAALACPDWQLTGQMLSYSADQLWTPQTLSVIAGGSDTLQNCPQPGVGHVATRPDFDLAFTGNGAGRDLEFRVNASCDTVLLVNDARGQWHFDDDGGDGLNARLRLTNAPEGAYDIWVGTYGASTCQATLTLETFGGAPGGLPAPAPQMSGSVPGCPDPALGGQTMTYRTADLARPQSFGVTAGGAAQLAACPRGVGRGYADARPSLTLDILDTARGAALDLRVDGTCDTVLLVNDPQGRWSFNDDAEGSINPRLVLEGMTPGQYDIWLGTYNPTPCAATLHASVIGGLSAPTPPPPQFTDPAPSGRYELVVVPEGITFDAARQRAGAMGGHLATIASADELQAVFAVANNPAAWSLELGQYFVGPWLGGYRQGNQWLWVTGEPWGFTAWAPGQPDNYQGRETHLNMWVRGTSPAPLLNDADPGVPLRGFVVEYPAVAGQVGEMALPASGTVQGFRDRVGQTLRFQVTGAAEGRVWGAGIYTDDSSVARAAVHAGLLQVGQSGVVEVMILPGQSSYEASSLNGVQTSRYGDWGGSFRFVVAPAAEGK